MPVLNEIYRNFPDGRPVGFNEIFDALDTARDAGEIRHKELKRFLYQYRDAKRCNDLIWNRYGDVERFLSPTEKPFMKNSTLRIEYEEARAVERPQLEGLLDRTEYEAFDAWQAVAGMISQLTNENQKLVMVAHYLCDAKWDRISAVYGHQTRWSRELHRNALNALDGMEAGAADGPEIVKLVRKWVRDNAAYHEPPKEVKPVPPLDETKLVMGLM